ncbi:uncharacterized protein LOC118733024 [Rhagoletis pomonella]|uniref:uncharacterized protein LOC118733024 n=1 Tax=Rhagoletis pomonella TaxID=28610 RepID=UPI001785D66B|nr:uncharacterized protein LOC118733024 [Rhagoletis pomonella]
MEYTSGNSVNQNMCATMCTPLHFAYPLSSPISSDGASGSNFTPSPPQSSVSSPQLQRSGNCQQMQQFTLMQMNGRKVLGPPEGWHGPPPSSACELFVRRIPRDLNEQKLIQPFLRFGRIYEIRLPMDFNQANRGYAYVKYTTEEEAACAMEVLSHFYIAPKRKLEILHSYEKCCLFVSNIPKHLDESEVEEKLRAVFPTMERVYSRGSGLSQRSSGQCRENDGYDNINFEGFNGSHQVMHAASNDQRNRGHVFIHFPSHLDALEAKKSTTPGVIRMWDRDLKVVWANTERDTDMSKCNKTLFVRNVDLCVNNRDIIDLLVNCVPRQEIRKITKVRTIAFFDFTTREAAEKCLDQLQGTMLRGQRLGLEWAKPSEKQSLHRMCRTDFDAMLRLKCIANSWQIPVIIFGTYYEHEGLQYGAVMLRNANSTARAIFCALQTHELVDIHSRICEVVCVLLETIGTFPDYNYVFFVEKDNAHLLGMVTHDAQSVGFIASFQVPKYLCFDLNELIDLSWAVATLAAVNEDDLLQAYHESFLVNTTATYLQNLVVSGHRVFGTVMPKYRNKAPLNHNLNDTQIVLALCYVTTGTNSALQTRPYLAYPASMFDSGYEGLRFVSLKLLPIAVTQSRFLVHHVLNHVQFGNVQYFHPEQRFQYPPLWITGCSYTKSLKHPKQERITHAQQHITQSQQQHSLMTNGTYMPATYVSSSIKTPIHGGSLGEN